MSNERLDSYFRHLEEGVRKVEAMPNKTVEDKIARAVALVEHNKTYMRDKDDRG